MVCAVSDPCCCGQCVVCQALAELNAETRVLDADVLRDLLTISRHATDRAWDTPCLCVVTHGARNPECPFCSEAS